MVKHSSTLSEHRVLVVPLSYDNSRSLTPVRIFHAHISETERINNFVNKIGQFVGTSHAEFSKDWKISSYEIMPVINGEYSGIVVVYYKNEKVEQEESDLLENSNSILTHSSK